MDLITIRSQMLKVFIDSSVLFTMCDSSRGASRELLNLAQNGYIQLITSTYAFTETEISLTFNEKFKAVELLLKVKELPVWQIVDATPQEYLSAFHTTPDKKDVSIVASAKKADIDFLISFDKKHLHIPTVEAYIDRPVVTPDIVLKLIRDQNNLSI